VRKTTVKLYERHGSIQFSSNHCKNLVVSLGRRVPWLGASGPRMLFRHERSLFDTHNGDEHADEHYHSRDDIEDAGH